MKNYQFEVLIDDINKNKEDALLRGAETKVVETKKAKKYKLKKWVKVCLWTLFVAYVSIAIYQLFTITTYHTTPVGTYTCKGELIQVCGGNSEVADYLGV